MYIKELKDTLIHFEDRKYNSYKVVFWDSGRQKKMDATFTGLSHPDKEISFNVWDEDNPIVYTRVEGNQTSLPDTLPSPFVEGEVATLHKEENYNLMGIEIDRYFYMDPSGHQFTTTASDTFTMCDYYKKLANKYKKILIDHEIDPYKDNN